MNVSGCGGGHFSDQFFVADTSCSQPRAAWIAFAAFICLINFADVVLTFGFWFKRYCTRTSYSRTKRRRFCFKTRLPVVPALRLMYLVLTALFLFLVSFNIANFSNGWSVAVYFISLSPQFVFHYVSARRYLRLGKRSIPLAKRLMSEGSANGLDSNISSVPTSPGTPSGKALGLVPPKFTFGAKDISRLSPISKSVLIRFHVWTVATVARWLIGVVLAPIFPQNEHIITIAFACQLVADVCITFMASQVSKSAKALDEILKTSAGSMAHPTMGSDAMWYLVSLKNLIRLQIVITMAIHAVIVAGIRPCAVFYHLMGTIRTRGRGNTGGYGGDLVADNQNFMLGDTNRHSPIGHGLPANVIPVDEAIVLRAAPMQKSVAKGIRSEALEVTVEGGVSRENNSSANENAPS